MRSQRFSTTMACLFAALPGLFMPGTALAAQDVEGYALEARVWLDRDPALRRGDRVRIYYRVDQNAYVALFHIDTNGTARMVFPSSPQENHYARGGRDYRVLFPGSSYWFVDDDPGVGYFFIVASPEPFDFRQFAYTHYSGGWDLSQAGSQVYRDPYLAMDDYVAALIPDWEYIPYGLDFTEYQVDGHYDYPRFLCYECHGFRPYYAWNPYRYSCTNFRVVIYSDPYFYPSSRYLGTRVVYVQPRRGLAHYGFKERAVGEPGTPHVVVRNTPPVNQPGVAGGEIRRAVPRGSVSSPPNPGGNLSGSSSGTGRAIPGVEGATPRRTSGREGAVPSPTGVLRGTGTSGSSSAGRFGSGAGTNRGTQPVRLNPPTVTTPPRTGTTGRPVLQPRTGSGGSRTSPPGVTTPPRAPVGRPSGGLSRPGRGGTTSPPAAGRGGSGASTTRPTVGSGGSRGTTTIRPTGRSGGTGSSGLSILRRILGGGNTSRPTARSGGSSSGTRPTVGGGGSRGTTTRPTVGSGGSRGTTTRPTVRSGGSSGTTSRPRATSGGSRTTTRPVVRRSGGTTTRPGGSGAKPPPTRKPRGGGA